MKKFATGLAPASRLLCVLAALLSNFSSAMAGELPFERTEERAFYYVRVLENPSCRWSTLQCQAAGVNPFADNCAEQAARQNEVMSNAGAIGEVYTRCCSNPDEQPFYSPTLQERAWTSPIWINPQETL